jgi:hypothetical protein
MLGRMKPMAKGMISAAGDWWGWFQLMQRIAQGP